MGFLQYYKEAKTKAKEEKQTKLNAKAGSINMTQEQLKRFKTQQTINQIPLTVAVTAYLHR